ncbi:adenosylcobinamide-GDP ribazoletransferase [Chitinilyticum litopenaei]|uniref:adenosylcobinamide-GDP ribazoletransferase n=1 Tax=Chitinilyticum litopenaei TaxID=1121276 RepID=UPI000410833A|nr:adenosylcobinamide-GDP ribazoletransferase [Chitinilyticum litopenaei]
MRRPDLRPAILAVQFLTRLPTPQVRDFSPALLSRAVVWFPATGLLLGALLAAAVLGGQLVDPWLAALAGLLAWAWLTGGLHLDGLADMADGLGAAHRDPQRFLAVLKDPHLGSFGVLALILQCASKLVLLMLLASQHQGMALLPMLVLVPGWARWGVYLWQSLPPLASGMAEQFGWRQTRHAAWCNGLLLAGLSLWLAPALLLAPLLAWAYRCWLKARLGGVTGDCLGAGIELLETALLCVLLLASAIIAL